MGDKIITAIKVLTMLPIPNRDLHKLCDAEVVFFGGKSGDTDFTLVAKTFNSLSHNSAHFQEQT